MNRYQGFLARGKVDGQLLLVCCYNNDQSSVSIVIGQGFNDLDSTPLQCH